MEKNEEFKRVLASIKELEEQLLKTDEKQLDQQGIKVVQVLVNVNVYLFIITLFRWDIIQLACCCGC